MTLRNKTLFLISLTLIILIVILYSISRTILHRGFNKVEKDLNIGFATVEDANTRRNVSRVVDALHQKIENLSTKASDWAQWDDTYKFVLDHNKAYAESNLEPSSVLNLKINYLLIHNLKGELVAGVGLDLDKGESTPLSEGIKELLKPGSTLLKPDSESDVKAGIVLLKECPLLIVSMPILKSDGTGPIHGTIIFARYLDNVEYDNLSSLTHLTLQHNRMDVTEMPDDFVQAQKTFSENSPIFVKALDQETISGYTEIPDIFGKPAIVLRIDVPRDIHKQGQETVTEIRASGRVTLLSMVISIIISGVILGIVILIILEKFVLSRIGRLSTKTVEIGRTGDFKSRVEEDGKDEIYSLSSSINKMLGALSDTHKEIESRNAEMRLLMNTIPAGILSLDENFHINPEYSLSAQTLLSNADLKGRSFAEALGFTGKRKDDGDKLFDYLDMVRKELASESTLAELNPFDEIKMAEAPNEKWLRTRFFLIRRGQDLVPHILVVIEDITQQKTLAQEVDKSHKENLQLKAIAEDPDLFREFLVETKAILSKMETIASTLSTETEDSSPVHEIFRGVHTIKGVSGSFGLFQVAELAGEIEDNLDILRNKTRLAPEEIEKTRESIKKLNESFNEIVESAKKIIGQDLDSGSGIFLRIPLDELKRYIKDIREMQIDESIKDRMITKIRDEILARLKNLTTVTARKGLARSVKIIPGLIDRLGKNIRFNFEGEDTPIDCEIAQELNTPLVHLIRNACDHGIESPEVRAEKGKPEEGVIKLSVSRENNLLKLSISDDGKGLDPEQLKQSALAKGIITDDELRHLTRERAFALIFRPGFSTNETVNEVSGRGVGMDAVLCSVRDKLKGAIEVESKVGTGTQFTMNIPV